MSYIAVIDVETTGLNPYRHDRVIEIAAVLIDTMGQEERSFVSLVNPGRDIGPSSVHGLVSSDIISAPSFAEIAGELVEILDGAVGIAGHNIRFDYSFLKSEFERIGYDFPDSLRLCTMQLAGGGSLSNVCSDFGIEFEGDMHSAWQDAMAAAHLLTCLFRDAPALLSEVGKSQRINWPRIPKTSVQRLTRSESRKKAAEPPTYLQKLLSRVVPELPSEDRESTRLAYSALLDRALEDRHIDSEEGQDLLQVAERWQISGQQVRDIHWEYLMRLASAALADGVITDGERRDLELVTRLLGMDLANLDQVLGFAQQKLSEIRGRQELKYSDTSDLAVSLQGKRVCFTGELQCYFDGEMMSREIASELAVSRELIIAESVTKKLDVLVVADPLTQSGKAKKARQYGIRIMHEPVFWRAVGVKVQ